MENMKRQPIIGTELDGNLRPTLKPSKSKKSCEVTFVASQISLPNILCFYSYSGCSHPKFWNPRKLMNIDVNLRSVNKC